jgi:lipoprotein-releasing system permease protein
MPNLTFLLAWRYLNGARKTTIGTMLLISFFSIYLSTTALTLVTFIMEGFEQKTHATLKGMHADLIMRAGGQHIDFKSVQNVLAKDFPEINSASPSDTHQGLIKSNNTEITEIIMLRGIDPKTEQQTSSLGNMLENKEKNLFMLLKKPQSALIGHKLAKHLKIKRHEPLQVLVADEQSLTKNAITFSPHTFIVTGIFKTGIEELDSNLVITSLSSLGNIIPESGPTTIHLNYASGTHEAHLIKKLKKRFGLQIYAWKDLYPALVEALALEKYTMIIVLGLMVLIASMSIVALLFMLITTKRTDQAILLAMGFSKKSCYSVFIIIGLIVSLSSCCAGLLTALLVGLLLQRYPIIRLPDAYFVSQLPIVIQPSVFWAMLLFIFAISLLASFLAVRKQKNISISQLLRQP